MSSLSVGTIETYSTELDQTQYGSLDSQSTDSLTLSDSNLWLVDSTTLDGLTIDELTLDGSTSLYSDNSGYLAPMSNTTMESTTGDITVYGSDPTADNILYTSSSSLQTSDSISLLEVQGETQGGTSLTSSSGSLSSSTTDSGFNLTSLDSPTDSTTSAEALALPSSDPAQSSDPINSGDPVDSGITTETAVETNSVSGSNPAPSTEIKDVPFEMHSALGLLVVGAIAVMRRGSWWKQTPSHTRTQTPRP